MTNDTIFDLKKKHFNSCSVLTDLHGFGSGNLLGQSINGLSNLLQMPYGCGEQNMLNFAPDVYILKYLETTGQSVGSVYNDALQFISTGLLRYVTCTNLFSSSFDSAYFNSSELL